MNAEEAVKLQMKHNIGTDSDLVVDQAKALGEKIRARIRETASHGGRYCSFGVEHLMTNCSKPFLFWHIKSSKPSPALEQVISCLEKDRFKVELTNFYSYSLQVYW